MARGETVGITWVWMHGETAVCHRCGEATDLANVEPSVFAVAAALLEVRRAHARCTEAQPKPKGRRAKES